MNKKELLLLSIIIFLTILMWLIADIYHAVTKETIKEKEDLPIVVNYKIDKKIFDILESKIE